MKIKLKYGNILLASLALLGASVATGQATGIADLLSDSAALTFGHFHHPHHTPELISLAFLCMSAIAIVRILCSRR